MKKIKLGDKVRDKLTGFEGIATAKIVYIYGCTQFHVTPSVGKDGAQVKEDWIDEPQLVIIKDNKKDKSKPRHGGVRSHP